MQRVLGYLPWILIAVTGAFCVWAVMAPTPRATVPRSVQEEEKQIQTEKQARQNEEQAAAKDLLVKEPGPTPAGMVWIPGGTFTMGNGKSEHEDEQFEHRVTLDGFWMDKHEVTKADFEKFVTATGYKTVAEQPPDLKQLVGVDTTKIKAEDLVPGSLCFAGVAPGQKVNKDHPLWPYQLWNYVKGADWRHPEGPKSSIADRMNHPVTHVCYDDVVAYAKWAGKQLPTEAEWEYAMRGGESGHEFPWGDELQPGGKFMSNIWQGEFPYENRNEDKYPGTAPVESFPPNKFGLYDMSGNVWEWCADWYQPEYYKQSPLRNPPGPDSSFDPNEPGIPKRVTRGGSFLCNANYCTGYRCSARMKGAPDTGLVHTGFRCVIAPKRGGAVKTAAKNSVTQ